MKNARVGLKRGCREENRKTDGRTSSWPGASRQDQGSDGSRQEWRVFNLQPDMGTPCYSLNNMSEAEILRTSPILAKFCELRTMRPFRKLETPTHCCRSDVRSVAGGHVERENKVASGKKFECEERKRGRIGNWEERLGRTSSVQTSRGENGVLGGKAGTPSLLSD